MKLTKRIIAISLSLMMCVTAFCTSAITASAASENISSLPTTIKSYPISTGNDTPAYSSQGASSKSGTIYAGDLCTINNIYDNGYLKVTYPTSNNKTRTLYVKSSSFFNATTFQTASITSYAKAYRRSSGAETIGSVDSADKLVYVIGNAKNNRYQISYKVTNANYYKLGWVAASAVKINEQDNNFIKIADLNSAASTYGISTNSNAYSALNMINTKYANKLTASQKRGVLVFMFEGVGTSSSTSKRENAMCVVVKNGKIIYINRSSSSIPDYPFLPSKNGGDPMPTLKSGIYTFSTVNHRGQYAALNVNGANVVRFRSASNWYSSTSSAINIHRKSSDSIASSSASWVNSAGCQLVGKTGTSSSSDYAKFIKSVGIVNSNASGNRTYQYSVTGKYIVDRTYAYNYLRNIGYSASAISAIG